MTDGRNIRTSLLPIPVTRAWLLLLRTDAPPFHGKLRCSTTPLRALLPAYLPYSCSGWLRYFSRLRLAGRML